LWTTSAGAKLSDDPLGTQEDGGWQGFSGELPVATVTKDPSAEREQWLWTITALKRPKGWRRGAGHRTSWIDAGRACLVGRASELMVGKVRCAVARKLQGRKDGDVRAELLDELAAWTRDVLARDGELMAERPV
jgi:hypothetical protein